MAYVSDNTKLIHMNLPGTHDTCTCNYYHVHDIGEKEIHGVECDPYRELYFGNPKIFGAIHWTVSGTYYDQRFTTLFLIS